MADEKYIKLEDAVDEFQEWLSGAPYWNVSGDDAEKILRSIPAADVRPVVHARWLDDPTNSTRKVCNHCGILHLIAQYPHGSIKYCPNCGADMREAGDAADRGQYHRRGR